MFPPGSPTAKVAGGGKNSPPQKKRRDRVISKKNPAVQDLEGSTLTARKSKQGKVTFIKK